MPSPGRLDSRMRGESTGEGGRSSSLAVPIHKGDRSQEGRWWPGVFCGALPSTILLYLILLTSLPGGCCHPRFTGSEK